MSTDRQQAHFDTWFAGSKIVDSDGAPLRLFGPKFSDVADGEVAEYSDHPEIGELSAKCSTDGGETESVFLCLRNPLAFGQDEGAVTVKALDVIARQINMPIDDIISNVDWKYEDSESNTYASSAQVPKEAYCESFNLMRMDTILDHAKRAGFDGLAVRCLAALDIERDTYSYDGASAMFYVPFSAEYVADADTLRPLLGRASKDYDAVATAPSIAR